MRRNLRTYSIALAMFVCALGHGQESLLNQSPTPRYDEAHRLAQDGDYMSAREILQEVLVRHPQNRKARMLLARTYSWSGDYSKARSNFNQVTSREKDNRSHWVSAIKNELYAHEYATALGLANKALGHVQDEELERLKKMAMEGVGNTEYPELGWHNGTTPGKSKEKEKNTESKPAAKKKEKENAKTPMNRLGVDNSVTVFNERYDPMFFANISYKRNTPLGTIIPRINYSSRVGKQGVQYDIDMYPRFAKGFYAYMNYGYSNATIYPKHKMGGDLYVSLPGAFEFSAGGRYIMTRTRNVTGITNSLGHYRGNYYFSLRSFITPKPDGLTRVSGNLLIRKYLKDSENYLGLNFGMGVSPEMRQIFSGDQLLAETLFFVESQRLNLSYRFTDKRNTNAYNARLGVRRQELSYDSGNFFWGVTAGLTYMVNF